MNVSQSGLRSWFVSKTAFVNKTIFICGGIGIGKFDMPEAQTQAGALQQGANFPDRFSYIHHTQLGDVNFNLKENRKTLQHIREIRALQVSNPRDPDVLRELQQAGMHQTPSWLENPALNFDVTQQIPPQTCHSEILGIAGRALTLFLSELTPIGRRDLVAAMERQVLPPHWQVPAALRLSLAGSLQCGVEDIRRHMQLIVFAMHGMLSLPPKKTTPLSKLECRLKFTEDALEKYRGRQHGRRQGTEKLMTAFVALAWSQKHTLARCRRSGSPARDRESLEEVNAAVLAGRVAVHENWPDNFDIPNFLTGRHYPSSIELFGVGSALSLCMEEMNHNLYKTRVKHTSGREVFKELMTYENFRQAVRYLLHIVKHNPNATNHPAILRLPEAVRDELLHDPAGILTDLMASRSVTTSYTSSTYTEDDVAPIIRTGHSVPPKVLTSKEVDEVLHLVLRKKYQDRGQRRSLKVELAEGVSGLSFVCLPHRSRHAATIFSSQAHADHKEGTRVNFTHYSVGSALPHGSTEFPGKVARVHRLFLVRDVPLACVTWGQFIKVEPITGCREYRFSTLSSVIKAERLISYVHFGILPGSRLLLNRFYVPRGLDDDK
jgi:hypothetical protein